jgi:hypothetical protein
MELQKIQQMIYEVRGVKVMLDKDLAELYQVTTGNLNKAVKRNIKRFPPDFMFQLTKEEWNSLRFQIGILDVGRGQYISHRKLYRPVVIWSARLSVSFHLVFRRGRRGYLIPLC